MIKLQILQRWKSDKFIKIVEVGVRDGLQNEQSYVATAIKEQLIWKLYESGLKSIEVTSFVSPKWVPQMADHRELWSAVKAKVKESIQLPVLVPNEKGLAEAISVGVKDIAVFTAASDTFNQRNINCNIEESLRKIESMIRRAKEQNIRSIRGYVSCAIGCPFEGWTDPLKVNHVTQALLQMGCYEVSLGDTIGVGTVGHVRQLLSNITVDSKQIAVHCHDTYGQALANILVALEEFGVTTVDSSVAGLGGCPFAPGATGNVSTEDVLYMLHGLGYDTGINMTKLIEAGEFICRSINRSNGSRAGTAILNSKQC